MKKAANNKETLDLYRSMLLYGDVKIVAEKAGVTTMSVHNFLNGKTGSRRVENAVLEVIAERRNTRNENLRKAGLLL